MTQIFSGALASLVLVQVHVNLLLLLHVFISYAQAPDLHSSQSVVHVTMCFGKKISHSGETRS